MPYTVPETIQEEATKCEHDLSCLESGRCGDRSMCEAEYANGKNVTVLRTTEPASCSYRLPYGGKQICTCPVRHTIQLQVQREA